MNIYLKSVYLDEIRKAASAGLADGVAFSQAAFNSGAPQADANEHLKEICREFAFPVCVSVGAVSSPDIYSEARDLAKISDHIVVQIPLVEDALIPISRLSAEGIVVCATFVFSAAQALIAAKAGASMVRVTLADLEEYGQSGPQTLAKIKNVLDASVQECDVMASSPGTAVQFAECSTAGADIICVTPETLRGLIVHPLTDRAVDRFLNNLSKHPRGRSST